MAFFEEISEYNFAYYFLFFICMISNFISVNKINNIQFWVKEEERTKTGEVVGEERKYTFELFTNLARL